MIPSNIISTTTKHHREVRSSPSRVTIPCISVGAVNSYRHQLISRVRILFLFRSRAGHVPRLVLHRRSPQTPTSGSSHTIYPEGRTEYRTRSSCWKTAEKRPARGQARYRDRNSLHRHVSITAAFPLFPPLVFLQQFLQFHRELWHIHTLLLEDIVLDCLSLSSEGRYCTIDRLPCRRRPVPLTPRAFVSAMCLCTRKAKKPLGLP